ncbi:MAG: PQQ-binding-like beta-propeller repeat protein [Verrucomicrobiales bacterium]|nr:PQQ-binding-like beta-propeller repeat protein [Verrucomicrobiales bacterium]
MRILSCLLFTATLLAGTAQSEDWPTFRHDAGRSGYTTEPLSEKLTLRWTHQMADPARPAWPRSDRMIFDRAAEPIVAGGLVYFGSSVDSSIHALDSATGETRWIFPTRAPIRLAPTFFEGRIYATSDDGYLYCLAAKTGELVWKKRGGPGDEMILGNGRMISRWPARGGVVIRDGILYFAAGIWPSDGVSLYALNPADGKVLWMNDTAGSIYMGQPHGGAFAMSGAAAQGYLVASKDRIFMATGRAVPASFDRATGEFQYLLLQQNTHRGGADVMLSDQFFVNHGYAFFQETGALLGPVAKGPVVEAGDLLMGVSGSKLLVQGWSDLEKVDRKGKPTLVRGLKELSSAPIEGTAVSMIGAGDRVVIGRKDSVLIENTMVGEKVPYRMEVSGTAYGLAAANGELYVSTDQGNLYCFGKDSGPNPKVTSIEKGEYREASVFVRAAKEIVEKSKIDSGYALDIGCGEGHLAIELAKRTDLFIYGVDADPGKIERARGNAIAAGVYGSRVMFLQSDPLDTKLPEYFANLVVSSASIAKATVPELVIQEAHRSTRPWGGTLATGSPGAIKVQRRGGLKGAGQWTHQYADASNSVNSGDELIQGPLGMLWFSDLEQAMTQRHGRAPAPLFNKGVLYSEGLNSLIAVDAYNGTLLWEHELPGILTAFDGDHLMGTSGTGSNYCVSDDAVFVRREGHCLRIDAKSGEILASFQAPRPKAGGDAVWGYLAHEDGLLFGTLSDPEHVPTYRYRPGGDMNQQLTESKTFFTLDAKSGELIWRYDAEHSIRHNAISIGNRAVVLIDRAQAAFDRRKEAKADEAQHPTGKLIALDAATGKELWQNDKEIYGTVLAISKEHHALMMSYQPTAFRLASEIGGRLSVFDLSDGKLKWEVEEKYASRPMINEDTIYAQGGAWDILTGAERPFNFKRSYGCGVLAGSRDMMVFRSATLGYFDLTRNESTEDFGGIRPGCWINAIPAGGLVFVPDASAGCKCSYLNQSWIALRPDGIRAPKIVPSAISDAEQVTVELIPDSPATRVIHYTMDGTSPTVNSPPYQSPLTLTETTLFRARSFGEKDRPSQVAEEQFTIDPNLVSLDPKRWQAEDHPKASPASNWEIKGGIIQQTSNVMVGGKATLVDTPHVERPGSLFTFDEAQEFSDGEIIFEIQSTDNDALGFVFRHQSSDQFYLWSMCAERPYRSLALKNGPEYSVFGSVKAGFKVKAWHEVRIVLEGSRVTCFFDGVKDFSVSDVTFSNGAIGFYSWGNSGSYFRNLRFFPAEKK